MCWVTSWEWGRLGWALIGIHDNQRWHPFQSQNSVIIISIIMMSNITSISSKMITTIVILVDERRMGCAVHFSFFGSGIGREPRLWCIFAKPSYCTAPLRPSTFEMYSVTVSELGLLLARYTLYLHQGCTCTLYTINSEPTVPALCTLLTGHC